MRGKTMFPFILAIPMHHVIGRATSLTRAGTRIETMKLGCLPLCAMLLLSSNQAVLSANAVDSIESTTQAQRKHLDLIESAGQAPAQHVDLVESAGQIQGKPLVSIDSAGKALAQAQHPVSSEDPVSLSPGATEAAEILGILPKVQRLIRLRRNDSGSGDPSELSNEALSLKVDVLDRILGQSLEVRVVADRIDRELSWSWASRQMLDGRRQKRLNFLFAANFMQGGLLGIVAGNEFLKHNPDPKLGSELLLIASGVGLALSTLSFMEALGQGKKPVDGGTTVLAEIFDMSQAQPQRGTDRVFKFLNAVPPKAVDGKTRRQALLESWKQRNYFRSSDQHKLLRLAAVRTEEERVTENIRVLTSRIRMLYDTQWAVEQFDSELLDLLRATDL